MRERIERFCLSRGGTLLLLILTVGDLFVQVVSFIATNKVLGGSAQVNGFHFIVGLVILLIAKVIKDDGEIWRSTLQYTNDFWKTALAISALLGLILYTPLLWSTNGPNWAKAVAVVITGVLTFLPAVATCKAFVIIWHRK